MASDSPRTGVATAAALLLPAALSGLAATGLTPVMPRIQQVFAGEPHAAILVRFLGTAIGLSMVFGVPLAGLLGSRIGRRPVLVGATIVYGFAGCAGLWLGSLPALAASRIVLGLSMAAIGTMITTILTLHFQDAARHRWLGYYSMTGTVFVLAIIPLSGWIGAIDWRAPFALHAIAFPLALLFFLALPRDAETALRTPPAADTGGRAGVPIGLLVFAVFAGSLVGGGPIFLPFRAAEIGAADPRSIALVLMPQVMGAGVTAFLFGRIRRRLSQRTTFIVAFGLIGSAFLAAGTLPAYGMLLVATSISGLGTGVITPNLFAMAASAGRDADRARTVGLVYGAFFAGPFVAQLLLEPIVQWTSAAGGIIGLAALAAALALAQILNTPAIRRG